MSIHISVTYRESVPLVLLLLALLLWVTTAPPPGREGGVIDASERFRPRDESEVDEAAEDAA